MVNKKCNDISDNLNSRFHTYVYMSTSNTQVTKPEIFQNYYSHTCYVNSLSLITLEK
jgi:hypothetical protein